MAFGPVKCDAPPVRAKPFDVQKASGYSIWNNTIFQCRSPLIQEIIDGESERGYLCNVFQKDWFWGFFSRQSFVVQSPGPWPLAPAAQEDG